MIDESCIVKSEAIVAGHRSQVTDRVRTTSVPGFISPLLILRLLLARLLPSTKLIVTD